MKNRHLLSKFVSAFIVKKIIFLLYFKWISFVKKSSFGWFKVAIRRRFKISSSLLHVNAILTSRSLKQLQKRCLYTWVDIWGFFAFFCKTRCHIRFLWCVYTPCKRAVVYFKRSLGKGVQSSGSTWIFLQIIINHILA